MMRSTIFLAGALVGASPIAAQPAPAVAVEAIDTAAIDARFDAFLAATPVPGMVYGLVRDGALVHVRTQGVQSLETQAPVTADTRFRIASMSKAFTALAILKLRDEGRLSLDDPAERHVPEMRDWRYPTSDSPRIRIRDLIVHVSGMVTDDPWGDRQQVLSEAEFTRMIAAGVPWSRVPQGAHEYSNYGYALLGRIVANVSGRPYQRYIADEILRPLGMAATGYEIGEVPAAQLAVGYRWENDAWVVEPAMRDGAFGAMGGLHTTADDYAKWVAFLLSAWPARDGAETGPVARATVREMAQGLNFVRVMPRPGAAAGDRCLHAVAYGMGMRAISDCDLGLTLHHGGGYPGYGSFVVLAPETGTALFAFTNRTYQAPVVPVWQSLIGLAQTGAIGVPLVPVSAAVRTLHDAARASYQAGGLGPLDGRLAVNFLMDRSAENWRREFARLRREVGACPTAEPIAATGQLSAMFRWTCERGVLDGQLLLAPTDPVTVQALRLNPVPRAR